MPMTSITLRPGVNVEKTLAANEAGVSQSQLIRYKDQLIQTYGGWTQFIPFTAASTVRSLHAWQDAAGVQHLAMAGTASLEIVTAGSDSVITPQTATTNFAPDFTSSVGSLAISIVDTNSSGLPSVYNTVFFNTPVNVAGQILSGAYKIQTVLSSISYTISLTEAATANVTSSGILPIFTTSSGSGVVTVNFPQNNYQQITGLFYPFYAPTSVGGLTIEGPYQVASIVDSTNFTINSPVQATSASTVTMNSSLAQLVYYVTIGPLAAGTGYGSGGYGSGGYGGAGTGGSAPATGTTITADDWTQDNWGQVLLSCPEDGPIYAWSPDNGFATAQVITQAPFFNGGMFVSMPQQILVAWRSCQLNPDRTTGGWLSQDNLLVVWSDAEDYTNWEPTNATAAGSFHIPTGSIIVGGIQAATQGIIWTDVDVWNMQYTNSEVVFNFNRLGSGCGLIGKHAAGVLSGNVYWCGFNNFFVISGQGVQVLNCPVWDFIFQNLNTTYQSRVVCATNTAFNEIAWFFPSTDGGGSENNAYVKINIMEGEWDYGRFVRTAWIDVGVLGMPIAVDTTGNVFQHETGNQLGGVSLPYFRSGWWSIADGNEYAFVDFIIPDFKWGTWGSTPNSSVKLTFYVVDYPEDTPRTYGPYTIDRENQYINLRARGRFMSVLVESADSTSFWRLGRVRFRLATSGRR